MKIWRLVLVAILAVGIGVAAAAWGEEAGELDPLLELLVKRGVITLEEARAVQAEYDRREAAEVPTVPIPTPTPPVVEQLPTDKKEHWYDRMEIRGDLRLRYEGFHQEGLDDDDRRDRVRLRLRPGVYTDITDWMEVGFQLRSGDRRDPVSDNQSVDTGFSLKEIAISEAYAAFDATDWLDLTIGKFDAKHKWLVSDMQWDDDVTVEGFMEQFDFGAFDASLYQYVLEEDKKNEDAYLIGGQLRGTFGIGAKDKITVGGGFDNWVRPQLVADLTLSGELLGNKITNLLDEDEQLISDFDIANLFVSWTHSTNERWPIKFSLFGYQNYGARGIGKDNDTGYFARLQVGDYKEPGQVMLRYSRYYSEADAIFYVFAQSDTTRASDVDGHRIDFRIGYVRRSYFNLTWYQTDANYDSVDTMDRWQVDYIIRF
jgi:hypothetical protein